jgi:hypothetical protein
MRKAIYKVDSNISPFIGILDYTGTPLLLIANMSLALSSIEPVNIKPMVLLL